MELSLKTNCGKFLKRLSTRPPELSPKKSVCRSKSNRTLPGITEWFTMWEFMPGGKIKI